MRRSALFVLTLHLAAAPLSAQVAAPGSGLEVRMGQQTVTYPGAQPAAVQPHPAAPVRESLLNFDPQHTEVVWSQNHWQLVADNQVLKDFGRREVEARVALRLVRDLHLTQHGVVGSPEPVMEYWLSNGRAPHGLTSGLHITPIDPDQLRVEQMQGQWAVRDPNRVLFNFGGHESDAHTALTIIHKYGFTQVGVIGNAGPSMLVMLGRGDAVSEGDPNLPHLAHQSPLHAPTPSDHNAVKTPALKAPVNDASTFVTPAIPPLHSATGAHTQKVNAFGRNETVEVLPASEPFLPKRTAPPPPLATELIDRTQFDWRQFQLRQEGSQHTLAAGTFVLARFSNEHEARLALATVQHYRFTEQDHIGRPQPFCSYFLCNGQPPRGQYLGMRTEAFLPDKLSVTQIENRWVIVNAEKPLLWFGDRPEEARVMLDVIQRNQFDRLCHIGDERGLTFFVRSR